MDENHFPVNGHTLVPPSYERLRLNHYHSKSEEEFVAKFERWRAAGGRPSASVGRFRSWSGDAPSEDDLDHLRRREAEDGGTDGTILMFAPALRKALGG